MNDDRLTLNGIRFCPQGNSIYVHVHFSCSVSSGLDVAEIPRVMFGRSGSAMRLLIRIEMSTRACAIRCAAITFLMDVETVFTGSQTTDSSAKMNSLPHRRERNRAAHFASLRRLNIDRVRLQ